MTNNPVLAEIERRIAIVRENLNTLIEQAAGYSGGETEELVSAQIESQQKLLEELQAQRKQLGGG